MTNYWPIDGGLLPRSRLSSLNTIRTFGANSIVGIAERTSAGNVGNPEIWASTSTRHGIVTSNGSISMASFVSAFGLGTPPSATADRWDYAQTFFAGLGAVGDFGLVAAGSNAFASTDTLLVLYPVTGSGSAPRYSYLTAAPRAASVCAFDNYLIAFNISNFPQRAQWPQRGSPSNWTGEGSGFEDLLEMRGNGTAVRSLGEGRFVLFTDEEIWYGLGATYPAQFSFKPLDPTVGCPVAETIQATEEGLIFVANDASIRLLPREGGRSRIIVPSMAREMRRTLSSSAWAVYDARLRLYHLYPGGVASAQRGFVVNVDTGEWGYEVLGTSVTDSPLCGLGVNRPMPQLPSHVLNEGMYFGNSTGTIFSTNSLLGTELGSLVTSQWRSEPIAADLPGNYKHLTQIDCDYRSTSSATVTVKVSQDGGNTFGYTAPQLALPRATVSGRATSQPYIGGAFPAIELTSSSTGYELHRLDVTMNLGGRA